MSTQCVLETKFADMWMISLEQVTFIIYNIH